MLNQPISSPMMNTMLGLFGCACRTVDDLTAKDTNNTGSRRPSHESFLRRSFIRFPLLIDAVQKAVRFAQVMPTSTAVTGHPGRVRIWLKIFSESMRQELLPVNGSGLQ